MSSTKNDIKRSFWVKKLLTLKRVPSTKCVKEAKEQSQSFIKHFVSAEFEKFESFDKFRQRVDEFLGTFLSEKF